MHFMNDMDIDMARRAFESNVRTFPVAYGAVLTLDTFREWVDSHSDGWAHWVPPVKAADRLMTLIEAAEDTANERWDSKTNTRAVPTDIDPAALRKAYGTIRAFATRYNNGKYGNYGLTNPLDFDSLISTVELVAG